MKLRYSLILLLLTCSCTKVGSNEWAYCKPPTSTSVMFVGNAC